MEVPHIFSSHSVVFIQTIALWCTHNEDKYTNHNHHISGCTVAPSAALTDVGPTGHLCILACRMYVCRGPSDL